MAMSRWIHHLFASAWTTRRRFGKAELAAIERAIGDVEGRHAGEIRVAIETALDLSELWQGVSPRKRALEVFGLLGVWDTMQNNGVLIYVLMADRDVEIIVDRGLARCVPPAEWERVSESIRAALHAHRYGEGVVEGVHRVGAILAQHFPYAGADRNEQPDAPVLL